jgi:hypothetical protein
MIAETPAMQCGHRCADDDFFCAKYQVWYPLTDCNTRVLHRTYQGCVDCFQGRVNLRHAIPAADRDSSYGAGALLRFPDASSRGLIPLRGQRAVPPKP